MRTSVFIPNISGTPYEAGLAASHASDRAKRRKSLTKLSMTELRVDDNHPFLPKSPTPPTISEADSPTEAKPDKLECLDRASFRLLMDDLDNITIKESDIGTVTSLESIPYLYRQKQAHSDIDKLTMSEPPTATQRPTLRRS